MEEKCDVVFKAMSMYHDRANMNAYGNPGFFVDRPSGTVADAFGKEFDLRPDVSRRNARRILVNSDKIKKDSSGVYHADIRPAKGVVALKLSYANIPRAVTMGVAQLVLYSIPIRNLEHVSQVDDLSELWQKYCRQQLLSKDTSHYPFFTPGVDGDATVTEGNRSNRLSFDFRGSSASGLWVEYSDRTTHIPNTQVTKYTNSNIDIDTLTVQIPLEVGISELGYAFQAALKNHTGVDGDKKNSMWNYFGIGVTDTGFLVEMDHDKASPFSTFAAFIPSDQVSVVQNDEVGGRTTARDSYIPLTLPITIYMDIARDAFVEYLGTQAVDAPTDIGSVTTQLRRIKPQEVSGSDFKFKIEITTDIVGNGATNVSTISFTSDVKLEDIKSVQHQDPIEFVSLCQIQKSFQRTRDIRLGLRWPGKTEDDDFTISGNYDYTSTHSVHTMSSLTSTPTLDTHNNVMTTSELEDTYIPKSENGVETQMMPVHKLNDADQCDEMMFCGHFMNVMQPSELPELQGGDTGRNVLADPTDPTNHSIETWHERPNPSKGEDNEYYKHGLGWETSIVHQKTRYIMPAFPRRKKETYSVQEVSGSGIADVMPLVARILNNQGVASSNEAFYDCKDSTNASADGLYNSTEDATGPVYFESKTLGSTSKNSIVVCIGSERYVVKRAWYISVLKNRTKYTLQMNCQDQSKKLCPLECVDQSDQEHPDLEDFVLALYKLDNTNKGVPLDECKYFSWCFELDREVELPTGLSSKAVAYEGEVTRSFPLAREDDPNFHKTHKIPPSVSERKFNGIADSASMFSPSFFYKSYGRMAVSKVQDAPPRFSVRHTGAAVEDKQRPVMRLHDIGNMEYPINSSEHMTNSYSFALLGTDVDQKKSLTQCLPSHVAFKSPINLNRLSFSFSTMDGAPYELKQNATFVFDVYSENE